MGLTISYSIHAPLKQSVHNEIFQEITEEYILYLFISLYKGRNLATVYATFAAHSPSIDTLIFIL